MYLHTTIERELYRRLEEKLTDQAFMNQLARNLMTSVLRELAWMEQSETGAAAGSGLDLYELLDYIGRNGGQVTLEELAGKFYYSAAYISGFLKEQTGMSFRSLVCRIKLEKARELLANTGMSIEQIADRMNYSSRKHFEKSYQTQFGQTPCQYRKSLQ